MRRINEVDWQSLATTVVTLSEVRCGAERARRSDAVVAEQIDDWIDRMLEDGQPQFLPMGTDASRLLGKMYETPSLRHFIMTDPAAKEAATGADLAIAAIAIAADGVVVTDNVGHFLMVQAAFKLPGLFNPLTGTWHVRPSDEPIPL